MAANPFAANPFAQPIPAGTPLEGELLPAKPAVSDNPFAPGYKPRSALGEIGSQAAGGLVGEVPKQAGQALQYISEPGQPLYETGKGWAEAAEKRLALPQYQPHPEQHGAVVNALASGARMLAPSVAAPLAVGAGLAALPEAAIGGTAALGLSALAGSVPAALQQGQQTLEDLRAQGVPEEDARAAARRTAAIEGTFEAGGTYLGGKLLGIGRKAISGAVGKGVSTGEAALAGATAPGLVRPFVKQLGKTTAGEIGTEIAQASGEAAVERAYGGKGPSPVEAAQQVVAPTAGLTLLLAPLGLAGFVHGNRVIQKRAAELASEKTDPAARAEAAAAIALEIHPHDPAAAAQFHANVMADIQAGTPIALGPELLGPRAAPVSPPPLGPVSRALDSAAASQLPGSPISPAAVPQELPLGPLQSTVPRGTSPGGQLETQTQTKTQPEPSAERPTTAAAGQRRAPDVAAPLAADEAARQAREVGHAVTIEKPTPHDARGRAQPGVRGEVGYPARGGQGVQPKGQEGGRQKPPRAGEAEAVTPTAKVQATTGMDGGPSPIRGPGPPVPQRGTARVAQEAEARAEPAVAAHPQGAPTTATTPKGQKVGLRYHLVEAADLVASHDLEGKSNPAYPKHLQPRDRSRQASALQIQRIAGNLQPERLGASPTVGDGAPIIGPDNAVESGNGRVLALRKVYSGGGAKMQAYRTHLRENAEKFGLTSTTVEAMKAPVLVRTRTTKMTDAERAAFARDANESTTAAPAAEKVAKVARQLRMAAREDLEKAKTPREIRDAKRRIADRLAAATKAAAPERRTDITRRKAIAEMSPEEMRRELLTDGLTGLGNRRAWEEADKGPVLASLDMDALKWVNDHMGHASGDKMLAAMGEALNEVMPGQAFHVSGDEFLAHFEGQKQADRTLGEVADLLNQATVSVRLPDGTTITKTGVGYSYGTGSRLEDAEAGLQRHKAERERAGLRATRGGEPAGVARTAPEGQPDRGREAAEEAVGPRYSYLGKTAALANHSALGEAIALSRTGTGMEYIREKTGWFLGPDSVSEFSGTGVWPKLIQDSSVPQGGVDRVPAYSKLLSDLLESKTFKAKGLGGFDVPTQRLMLSVVLSAVHNAQIRDDVIKSLSIDVVNNLRARKLAPEVLFNNMPMLGNLLTVHADNSIPISVNVASSLARKVARSATKLFQTDPKAFPSGDPESLPAIVTNDRGAFSVLGKTGQGAKEQPGFTPLDVAPGPVDGKSAYMALDDRHTASDKNVLDSGILAQNIKQVTSRPIPQARWRFELSDKDSTLKPGWYDAKTVGEAFRHDKLFANYPALADTGFSVESLDTGVNGYFDPKRKKVVLNANAHLDAKAARSVLLHELQHVVQNIERFSGGGSPDSKAVQALALKRWETERAPLTERLNQLSRLQEAWTQASVKDGTYPGRGTAYIAYREKHPGYASEADKLVKQLDDLDLNRVAHRTYRRLLGEVEARDVQFRADMSEEERRFIEPYISQGIDERDFIVGLSEKGGTALAAAGEEGVTSEWVRGDTTSHLHIGLPEKAVDARLMDAELFGDSRTAETIRVKGFDSLNRIRQRSVLASMVRVAHDHEIARTIVKAVPIDVVDNLVGKKGATQDLLHNPAMLADLFPIDPNDPVLPAVRRFIEAVAALKSKPALRAAKQVPVTSDIAGEPMKGPPAGRTIARKYGIPPEQGAVLGAPGRKPGAPILPRHTARSLKAELHEVFGQKATDNLLQSALEVVERDDQLPLDLQHPEGDVRGVFDPRTGKTWFVAGNVHKGEAKGLALHEIGTHAGMESMLGPKLWAHVLGQVEGALGTVELPVGAVKAPTLPQRYSPEFVAAVKAARARVPEDTRAGLVTEETLANLVEDPANHDLPLVRRILAAIRAWLIRQGIPLRNITAADLAQLAAAAVRRVSRGETVQRGAGATAAPAYAAEAPIFYSEMSAFLDAKAPGRAPAAQWKMLLDGWAKAGKFKADELEWQGVKEWLDLQQGPVSKDQVLGFVRGLPLFARRPKTETPAFKAWFGNSKVVDENGKPLVVYHGTTERRLHVLSPQRAVETRGAVFLSDNEDVASTFTVPREYGEPVFYDEDGREIKPGDVHAVYAKIENPLVVEGPEAQRATDDSTFQQQLVNDAKAAGHDGIILRGVKEGIGETYTGTTYAVFNARQVKSVKNRGTFDPANPDIRYSRGRLPDAGKPLPYDELRKVLVHNDIDPSGLNAWVLRYVNTRGGTKGLSRAEIANERKRTSTGDMRDLQHAVTEMVNRGLLDVAWDKEGDSYVNLKGRPIDRGEIKDETYFDKQETPPRYSRGTPPSGRPPGPTPTLPPAAPPNRFTQENARLREEDKTIWNRAKKFWQRNFTPGGLLPEDVFKEKIIRDNELGVVEFDTSHLVGQLDHAVKRVYGKRMEQLTKEQRETLQSALTGNPESLDPRLRTVIEAMRQHVDRMSGEYVTILEKQIADLTARGDPAAVAKAGILQTITGNLGRYVHRSYRAFDDPQWFSKLPNEVIDAARTYLRERNLEGGMSVQDAEAQAEHALHTIVKTGTAYDSMESFIREGKLGAKDLTILIKRKDIAPEIRALLGEYDDPRLNYAKSTSKMGRLIWNQRFLDRVREIGMGTFLFEERDAPPGATTKMAADASEVYSPLNGLWTFPEIEQAFKDAVGKEKMADWYRVIVQMNGLVKYGKANSVDSAVYTPTGPKRMGDIRVGDRVCGINGATYVLGVYPQGEQETFTVSFADGARTEVTAEHLWQVIGPIGYTKYTGVFTTQQIASWPEKVLRDCSVPLAVAEFDEKPVPLDPYLLGAMLGNGYTGAKTPMFSTPDTQIVEYLRERVPEGHKVKHLRKYDYSITAAARASGNLVSSGMKELDLWGKLSYEKFIPEVYRYNSTHVRMNLLRGLLDTDGWVVRDGQPGFSTASKQLALDVREVAESLGATVLWDEKTEPKYTYKGELRTGRTAFMLKFRVPDAPEWFCVSRKKDLATFKRKPVRRTFRGIEPAGTKLCQCIRVADPASLYLTDRFVVTHNTILSPTTSARNWMSAAFFAFANGHFDLRHVTKSISGLREYFSHGDRPAELEYLRKLKRLGVVYDTAYAGEMMQLIKDSRIDEILADKKSTPYRMWRDFNTFAKKAYQYGDDFWKIVGFENEKAMLMGVGVPEAQAETEAADRIRNTYPTYSMVGRGVRWLARFPVTGAFVSFPAEILRTTGNMLRTVSKDYQDPQRRPLAIRRAVGMAMVSGFAYGLQALTMAMFGVDDDEEEAVRRLAAPWQKNSNLLFTGRDEEGKLRYFDLSFLDPYNWWKRPITAMLRDQPWEDKAVGALRDMLSPFLGTDIAAGAFFEVLANKKESGGPVFNEFADPVDQSVAIANHLRKALQPGFVGNLERTYRAAKGEYTPSGKKYSLADEGMSWIGWRPTTLDPKTSLYYRSFEFADAKKAATATLNRALATANEVSQGDIASAKADAQRQLSTGFQDMHLIIEAAKKSGLSRPEIIRVLRTSGVSMRDIPVLLSGREPRLAITPQQIRNAAVKARAIYGPEKAREIQRRYREAVRIEAAP